MKVVLEGWKLMVYYKGPSAESKHYHYDVFEWVSPGSKIFPMKLFFHNDLSGEITSLDVPLETNVDPISFKRLPPEGFSKDEYLEQFAGSYVWDGKAALITLRNCELSFAIPQFENLTLIPKNTSCLFSVKGKPNWMAEFNMSSEGTVASISLITPSGLFTAAKQK